MKKSIIVDIDTEREDFMTLVTEVQRTGDHFDSKDSNNILEDMAVLCEGLICLIHSANKLEVKKDFESVASIIKHIQSGFVDSSYWTKRLIDGEEDGEKESDKKT